MFRSIRISNSNKKDNSFTKQPFNIYILRIILLKLSNNADVKYLGLKCKKGQDCSIFGPLCPKLTKMWFGLNTIV